MHKYTQAGYQQLQMRLQQAENDKAQLKKSIQQLNECYESKINILEQTIEAYQDRLEELLQSKKADIEKELCSSAQFEQENQKLMNIIQQLETAFAKEKEEMMEEIRSQVSLIEQKTRENEELAAKGAESEAKIDLLVKEHTREIELLKGELLLLKEEIEVSPEERDQMEDIGEAEEDMKNMEQQQAANGQSSVLQQIKDQGNAQLQKEDETRIKTLIYRSTSSGFVSI